MMGTNPPPESKDLFGVKKRLLQACADLSDAEMADLLGASVETVHGLRRGDAEPTADQVLRVCRAREISPLWMLAGIGPREGSRLERYFAGEESSPNA